MPRARDKIACTFQDKKIVAARIWLNKVTDNIEPLLKTRRHEEVRLSGSIVS